MSKPSVTLTLNLPEGSAPSETVARYLLHWVLENAVVRGKVCNQELTEEEVNEATALFSTAIRTATLEVTAS